ncbi:restriction endonuclease subunit S [Mycolicibacter arupensis]|jgi:type I restriction enzyme S subunit|uniref:restriction endonuclease subunit S n=1 Tax=Mycolicibacter arupensis TaxID=342002 RepID=UPI001F21725F|nr:restriction endonuclease subunit S [Mycolicibacter arupensis]
MVPLGEVVEFLDHLRKPVTAADRATGPYPYYGANGQQGTIDSYIFNEPLLLLAEDGGHFDNPSRGIAYRISGASWVNNHAHVLRMTSALDIGFAHRVLATMDVRKYVTGTTRAKLTKSGAAKIEIPLPPLPEQRRIAAILDHADALRARRRQVISHLDDLAQSIFLDMFGYFDGEYSTVEGIARSAKGSIRTGPFGSQLLHSEFVDAGIAVLGLDNVVGNEFSWGERRYITPEKYEDLRRYTVSPGDVLVSIMGTCGRCVVVPAEVGKAINTKHICAITLDYQRALPEFVRAAFLWHPRSRRHLKQQTKGSIMDGLNMGIVKAMPLPVPDIQIQREFVARLNAVGVASRSCVLSATNLEYAFASLQSRAFRGEL